MFLNNVFILLDEFSSKFRLQQSRYMYSILSSAGMQWSFLKHREPNKVVKISTR